MPRASARSDPSSSPQQRQQRHYRTKRDQVLRALGTASSINGSQFAILLVNARGETEEFASELFQQKLPRWFTHEVLSDAQQTVLQAGPRLTRNLQEGLEEVTTSDRELSGELAEDLDKEGLMWQDDGAPLHTGGLSASLDGGFSLQHGYDFGHRAPPDRPPLAPPMRASHSGSALPRPIQSLSMPEVPTLKTLRQQSIAQQRPLASNAPLIPMPHPDFELLTLADASAVALFFEKRFRQLQQLVCKIVAKAWIKVLEPKKQTRFPYNKGDEAKPHWWPADVRHKEPDHLMKPERMTLLMVMLRSGRVPISRLEMATGEIIALIPADKVTVLREVYRVAREEERLRNNEVQADHRIYVAIHPGAELPPELVDAAAANRPDGGPLASLQVTESRLVDVPRFVDPPFTSGQFTPLPRLTRPQVPLQQQAQQQQQQQQQQQSQVHHQQLSHSSLPSSNGFYYGHHHQYSASRSPQEYNNEHYAPVGREADQHQQETEQAQHQEPFQWHPNNAHPSQNNTDHSWHQPTHANGNSNGTNGSFYAQLEQHMPSSLSDDKAKDLSNVRSSFLHGPMPPSHQGHHPLAHYQAYINSPRHPGQNLTQTHASPTEPPASHASHHEHGQREMTY